jgi:hypothetical protein
MAGAKMNVSDVMKDMRKRGYKISYGTLVNGIDMDVYPFANQIGESKNGRRQFLIFRKDYESWANEKLGGYVKDAAHA